MMVVWLGLAGCSVVVDRKAAQCEVDADCAAFDGFPTCLEGVCSALGPAGCFQGAPTTQAEYLNACSTSRCVPFDNCEMLGMCSADGPLPATTEPSNPKITALVNPVDEPTQLCTDDAPGGGRNVIYMLGAADFGPLLRAAQPFLSRAPTPYRAVFQNASSCAGVSAIFQAATMRNPVNPSLGGWAFYFDDTGTQVNCKLAEGGNPIDIGVSDLYAGTCDPSFVPGGAVGEYLGPVVPFVLSVPAMSNQPSISMEAAHLVFGRGGKPPEASGLKDAPWNDPAKFAIRNSGAASTVLTALLTEVPKDKFHGVDRLSTDNLRDSLLTSTDANGSIGILSVDYNDKNRGNLRALYLQARGQQCGYQPDSSPTTYDKANVRDGHYPLWGYVHFFTPLTDGDLSPQARAMVLLFNVPKLEQGLLDEIIAASLIPQCAMEVARTSEVGGFTLQRGFGCGCYFDLKTRGKTSCTSCTTGEDCPSTQPNCNYGYCEAR
jgi:hypothetical protein